MIAKKRADEPLVLALACGATPEAAAQQCGIDEKAVTQKLADGRFRKRIVAARATLTERTCGLLTAVGLEASPGAVSAEWQSGSSPKVPDCRRAQAGTARSERTKPS